MENTLDLHRQKWNRCFYIMAVKTKKISCGTGMMDIALGMRRYIIHGVLLNLQRIYVQTGRHFHLPIGLIPPQTALSEALWRGLIYRSEENWNL